MKIYYLVSIIFFLMGLVLIIAPPNRNNGIGYKSPFAMKNEDTWKEANTFAGIMAICGSIIASAISFILTELFKSNQDFISKICALSTAIIIIVFVFYTEVHLRRIFDKEGNRK
ncbi:SdpI family protein [Inconstantimicrobium mannanitabidum]|uniref:Uncharacterized protein n=1 Tax=Inconstantimicrobium mannanitabidum TaxID=1604901 RepID=A0ACB5RA41_9CLOT|nr:SdpI family protein [Clostridium sp. TW13]GKX65899.1 hypothetical protein rsdtw13_11570 [Clostridium sp. TW13]